MQITSANAHGELQPSGSGHIKSSAYCSIPRDNLNKGRLDLVLQVGEVGDVFDDFEHRDIVQCERNPDATWIRVGGAGDRVKSGKSGDAPNRRWCYRTSWSRNSTATEFQDDVHALIVRIERLGFLD